jgi:hypothetical protein
MCRLSGNKEDSASCNGIDLPWTCNILTYHNINGHVYTWTNPEQQDMYISDTDVCLHLSVYGITIHVNASNLFQVIYLLSRNLFNTCTCTSVLCSSSYPSIFCLVGSYPSGFVASHSFHCSIIVISCVSGYLL